MTARRLRETFILCCATLLGAGCSRATSAGAPATPDAPVFRGVYETGPDRSAFVQCGNVEQWYVPTKSAPERELRRLTIIQDMLPPEGGLRVAERAATIRRAYVEVQGDTGSLSAGQTSVAYDRELRVTRILAVRPSQGGVCR